MGKKQSRIRRLSAVREALFPKLSSSDYEVTSEESTNYNCIAYAADDVSRKWTCLPFIPYYWPSNAMQGGGIDALISAFEAIGYETCGDGEIERGFEKVALYGDSNDEWTHAAKQLGDGHWTSKLGNLEDIRHAKLESLEGKAYGTVVQFMKRPCQAD